MVFANSEQLSSHSENTPSDDSNNPQLNKNHSWCGSSKRLQNNMPKLCLGQSLVRWVEKWQTKQRPEQEEQVGIVNIQMGESIKRKAVYGDVDGGREQRTLIEADPMDVVVIGHGLLNYSNNCPLTSPFIWTERLSKYPYSECQHSRPLETREQT
jgi:hypothetical protein